MDGEGKSQARRSRLIQVNSDNRLNHAMPGRTEKTVVVGYIYIKKKRLSPVHNRSQNFLRRSTKQTPCFNDYSPSRIGPHWSFHNFFLYLIRKKNKIGMMLVTYWNKGCFSSRISGLNDFSYGEKWKLKIPRARLARHRRIFSRMCYYCYRLQAKVGKTQLPSTLNESKKNAFVLLEWGVVYEPDLQINMDGPVWRLPVIFPITNKTQMRSSSWIDLCCSWPVYEGKVGGAFGSV